MLRGGAAVRNCLRQIAEAIDHDQLILGMISDRVLRRLACQRQNEIMRECAQQC
jgi:hypothetical protein